MEHIYLRHFGKCPLICDQTFRVMSCATTQPESIFLIFLAYKDQTSKFVFCFPLCISEDTIFHILSLEHICGFSLYFSEYL